MSGEPLAAQVHDIVRSGLVKAVDIVQGGCGHAECIAEVLLNVVQEVHTAAVQRDPSVCQHEAETAQSLFMTGLEVPLFPEVDL